MNIKSLLLKEMKNNDVSIIKIILDYAYEVCVICKKHIKEFDYNWCIFCYYCGESFCINCSDGLIICNWCQQLVCQDHFTTDTCYNCVKIKKKY